MEKKTFTKKKLFALFFLFAFIFFIQFSSAFGFLKTAEENAMKADEFSQKADNFIRDPTFCFSGLTSFLDRIDSLSLFLLGINSSCSLDFLLVFVFLLILLLYGNILISIVSYTLFNFFLSGNKYIKTSKVLHLILFPIFILIIIFIRIPYLITNAIIPLFLLIDNFVIRFFVLVFSAAFFILFAFVFSGFRDNFISSRKEEAKIEQIKEEAKEPIEEGEGGLEEIKKEIKSLKEEIEKVKDTKRAAEASGDKEKVLDAVEKLDALFKVLEEVGREVEAPDIKDIPDYKLHKRRRVTKKDLKKRGIK
jgi:hypothetical protein